MLFSKIFRHILIVYLKDCSAPPDATQVAATKQLKSGDLCLQLRSAAEADVVRRHAKS